MREVLNVVPKLKSTGKKVMTWLWLVLACLSFVLCLVNPFVFLVPLIVFGVVWYWQAFQSDVEYEYTYYEGDLKIAMIKAKRKRKKVAYMDMDNVIAIAPKGDRSMYKYENDRTITRKNVASGRADAKVYEVVWRDGENVKMYEFEPDEEMLDAIMVKYPRSVVK